MLIYNKYRGRLYKYIKSSSFSTIMQNINTTNAGTVNIFLRFLLLITKYTVMCITLYSLYPHLTAASAFTIPSMFILA
jgi:hypothetical protein